jgi:hypothetical protein
MIEAAFDTRQWHPACQFQFIRGERDAMQQAEESQERSHCVR